MTFTELLQATSVTYREQSRKFHILATRYYIGRETRETLAQYLDSKQVDEIINNR